MDFLPILIYPAIGPLDATVTGALCSIFATYRMPKCLVKFNSIHPISCEFHGERQQEAIQERPDRASREL